MIRNTLILIIFTFCLNINAQQKVTLDGYLNDMQSVYHMEQTGWLWENQLHNRLNLNIYPAGWLKVSIQTRTRLIQGSTYSTFPGYADMIGRDPGWLDLAFSAHDSYNDDLGYIIASKVDRLYAEFSAGNWVATVGRQRINWGQTFAWNPNDIFNSYSYFDVDYPERPGSDAIRIQYYTGIASNIELAAKADSAGKVTGAGYFRFNTMGYDFQLLGGVLSGSDLVLGTGWSGNIVNSSFRGELSYFRSLDNFADTSGQLLVSTGIDHTFSNSLWMQAEVLYSGFAREHEIQNFMQILGSDMDVRQIGFTKWSVFTSLSFPVTPLLNASLAGIWFPSWKGYYIGPSVDLSLSNNISASLISQLFSAEQPNPVGERTRQTTWVGYARIKWSF